MPESADEHDLWEELTGPVRRWVADAWRNRQRDQRPVKERFRDGYERGQRAVQMLTKAGRQAERERLQEAAAREADRAALERDVASERAGERCRQRTPTQELVRQFQVRQREYTLSREQKVRELAERKKQRELEKSEPVKARVRRPRRQRTIG